MDFPLDARFKLLAISSEMTVTDAYGSLLFFAKQKAFKLKESVTVYADQEQTRQLYRISADRILDLSARYRIEDPGGAELGVLQRQGMRSIWRAHYDIAAGGTPAFAIREENPWIKIADGIFSSLPVISLLAGYVFNPAYIVSRGPDGPPILRVAKRPALFEGHFEIEALTGEIIPDVAVIGVLMMLLLERARG